MRASAGARAVGVVLALCCATAACAPASGQYPLARAPVSPLPVADPATLATRPLVGAHYYHWYPGNWSVGTLRGQLTPPQEPVLGLYSSTDTAVAEQHIAWASEHGIDFFTLDWWPVHHQENQTAIPRFLEAANIRDISFTIFYETWDLSFDAARGYADVDRPGVRQAFLEDMAQVADHFDHPSYLRVDGRPVVFLYLTRVLVGDVAGAIADVRAMWRQRGHDPFVIADEVFWRVTVHGGARAFTSEPQASRVRLFDAVTAYNPYESETASHAGYGADSQLVPDVNGLYQRYVDATDGAVPIVPGVLPGYNDRGVRPTLDHYVIPRAWSAGAGEGTFLAEMLRQVADRWIDARAPMVLVTSWNEWNEDTGIEPLRAAPATAADTPGDGFIQTGGYAYEGFGTRYLEVVRDHFVAIAGRAPPGALVSAVREGAVVAQDVADRNGRYTLSRAQVGTEPVTVVAERQSQVVTPEPARTVTADFSSR